MSPPTISPHRPAHVPASPERTSPDQAQGSGLRSRPQSSSPVNAYLSPRRGHGGAPRLNAGMGQPASPPRFALGNLPARGARLPHQVAVSHTPAGPSRAVAAQATNLTTVKQELGRWANAAKATPLPDPRFKSGSLISLGMMKSESIDAACKAVWGAAQPNATSLRIENLRATELPSAAISELQGLEHMALQGTLCRKLDFTPNFDKLKTLELTGNVELDTLPENIGRLKALTTLDIRNSPLLQSLPTGIGELPRLETLKVSGTSVGHLPTTITNLSNSLRTLDISAPPNPRSENGLQKLPDNIGDFQQLTTLTLRHQEGLKELPATLGDLSKLETLDLSNCRNLKRLPDLSKLSNLKTLNLSGCSQLKQPLESLAKLPADCKITLADHWQQEKLNALRSRGTQQQVAATGSAGTSQLRPQSPKRPAELQQTLEGWKAQLKEGKGERGAERFNIWLGKNLDNDTRGEIQAVVNAAAESPVFRAELFALAAKSVEVPRKFGVRQPDRATVDSSKMGMSHVRNLLLKHQLTDPRLDDHQALEKLKKLATNDNSFARELGALFRPGTAGSGVPPVLAAYVQAHDEVGKAILETRQTLERNHGGRSGSDDAAAHAMTLAANDVLLHGRYVEVARELIEHRVKSQGGST